MSVALATDRVLTVRWESHVHWLREHLRPGQHVSVIQPTGGGKSYLVVEGLLKLPAIDHARVLFIDDKEGKDQTTREFGTLIHEYPLGLRKQHGMREQLPHYRLVVPDWTWSSTGSHVAGVARARALVGRALDAFYLEAEDPADPQAREDAQASVVVIDEAYALTAHRPPSLNLAPLVVRNWRKGRYKGLSQVALSQEPLWMPSEFYSQPTHLYLGRILDRRQQERLREIGGNTQVIIETVSRLGEFEFLFLGNKGTHMAVVKVGR
jgi:hypothetical protein